MPQYFSPGVYVEEVDSGPRPIEGVSTSVAGAVGVTQRGPIDGAPKLVTSFAEFKRVFGGYVERGENKPDLGQWWRFPNSIRGFFENGGQQLYVKRVVSATATFANQRISDGRYARIVQDVPIGGKSIRVSHVVGIGSTVDVRNGRTGEVLKRGLAVESFTVGGSGASINLSNATDFEIRAGRGDFVELNAPANERLVIEAVSQGSWGKLLSAEIMPMTSGITAIGNPDLEPFSGTLAADAVNNGDDTWTLTFDAGHSLATDHRILLDGKTYKLVDGGAADTFKIDRLSSAAAGDVADGAVLLTPKPLNDITAAPAAAVSKRLYVRGLSRLYVGAIVELGNGESKLNHIVKKIGDGFVVLDKAPGQAAPGAASQVQFFEEDDLFLVEASVEILWESERGSFGESFDGLKVTQAAIEANADDPRLLVNHVNANSKLVRLSYPAGQPTNDLNAIPGGKFDETVGRFVQLANGEDKNDDLTVDDFVGAVNPLTDERTGIRSLELIDDISLVMVPGVWAPAVGNALLQHCESVKYRMAILDAPLGFSVEDVAKHKDRLDDSKRGAFYYPWVKARQPGQTADVDVPPSGAIAGIYADVDSRRGYYKPPGNEVVRGITEFERTIIRKQQDVLNPKGINVLRGFPRRGNRVWGARTISSDTNFKYVNVRRIFDFIERSIDEGTQWVVFEPNNAELWSRVRQSVNNFLNTQWRAGALEGAKPEDAYFVACDRGTTMTQDDIENGRLIVEVGIAPVYPAEFVIFKVQKYVAASKLA